MKKILMFLLVISFASCKRMTADYQSRLEGIRKVCPKCTFVTSEGWYYAQDTSKNPNIVYKVYFKTGGAFYTASDVDHMVRIN